MEDLKKLTNFWCNKKVFITGHTGFKGAWLLIFLNILGAKLYGYSLKTQKNSLFSKIASLIKLKKNINNDILNLKLLKKSLNEIKPDIVFHLAAQSLVGVSYKNPVMTFDTNIIGTLNILEAARSVSSIKSIIIVTTDKVYKIKKGNVMYSEKSELGGNDPYSSSKACAELITTSYIKSFFKNSKLQDKISTVRSGNVIGGGDFAKDRLVPDIMRSIGKNTKLIIRNPNYVRPWQHVIEPLYGYILLAQKQYLKKIKLSEHSWNFGPRNKNFVRVIDIVNIFKKNTKINLVKKGKNKIKETKILKLNSKKARTELNWRPKWNINTTVDKMIEWNNNAKNKNKIVKICEKQIYDYLNS
jgi:CDP-glucose 4,6-dehydratase